MKLHGAHIHPFFFYINMGHGTWSKTNVEEQPHQLNSSPEFLRRIRYNFMRRALEFSRPQFTPTF